MTSQWEKLKNEGNNLLKDGNCQAAIEKYTEAINLCEEKDVASLQILYSNRSAAYLKNGEYEKALNDAEKCIDIAPDWVKGYGRKAAVLKEMKNLHEAINVANEGLKLESTNVALKTIKKACETSLVSAKLNGVWHGVVSDEVGGYLQIFDFLNESDVRVTVLGTIVDAKFELNVDGMPYPHLDMSVPSSPGNAFVRHIYKFANNDNELYLCSPYLRPPEERPTEFTGAGLVIMKRGPYVPSDEEKKEREQLMSRPLQDRVSMFLEQCIEAVPKFDVRPVEGDSDIDVGKKLTANVKFQTFYQGLIERLGADAEQHVKELVVGAKPTQQETPKISSLVKDFQTLMRQAGLFSDNEEAEKNSISTNAVVGLPPEEALKSKESISKYISGAEEPLVEPLPSEGLSSKPNASDFSKPSSSSDSAASADWTPVVFSLLVITGVALIAAGLFFKDRRHDKS